MAGGAPVGNSNAKRGAMVRDGLMRALGRDDWRRFNQGCERIANAWAKGEPWACVFVADRLDGRVLPMPEQGVDSTLVISWVMQGQPARQAHDVIEHQTAEGPIAAVQHEAAPVGEIPQAGGVGGGGGTPAHTVTSPNPGNPTTSE